MFCYQIAWNSFSEKSFPSDISLKLVLRKLGWRFSLPPQSKERKPKILKATGLRCSLENSDFPWLALAFLASKRSEVEFL